MRSLFFAVMALGMLAGFAPSPAQADGGPFCLRGQEIADPLGDCSFPSVAACQAAAAGRYMYCDRNPFFAANEYAPQQRRSRRVYREPAY